MDRKKRIEQLGERIRVARYTAKLTQSELAELLNTTQTQITRWETGRREPTATMLLEIATATHSTLNYLLSVE